MRPGDCLVVHSSFKSLGLTSASPADVVASLLDWLGPSGTLVMPTFTYSYAGAWNATPYRPDQTPGVLNGVLAETLRAWPGACRSGHPTYSVAACGQHAMRLTQRRETGRPLGKGSAYDEACRLGAKVLLLGVGHIRNSMLHHAEAVAELPYLDIPWRAFLGRTALVEKLGKVIEVPLADEFPACSLNFGVVGPWLAARGIGQPGRIAAAECWLGSAPELVAAVAEELQRNPAWLLCNLFGCEPCTLRRRRLRERGLL
ncbi:AAC(3) family N-acetyltransferase [bacterium]|nr:AAC(3) family N-acetyltransferase [bacterium]